MTAPLQRQKKDALQVTGTLTFGDQSVFTLEKLSTLIAAGTYPCEYTRSNRLSTLATNNFLAKHPTLTIDDVPYNILNYYTYEILNVPNRSGLRIHPDSFAITLEGCVAPALSLEDINNDGEVDGVSSRMAVDKLETYMNKKPFTLKIIDIPAV